MDDFYFQLRQLIAKACHHPPKSLERRRIISKVHQLVMKSGKLWKEYNAPYYNDALQQMWEYCTQHPEEYDPEVNQVTTWLNDYLKKRLRNFRDAKKRNQRRHVSSWQNSEGKVNNPIDSQAAPEDIQPTLDIWKKTVEWVEKDPDGVLQKVCFRKRPEINAQVLILRRLPPDEPWKNIATEFNLNPAEAKDLPKFYSRKCIPLLRQFGTKRGYID